MASNPQTQISAQNAVNTAIPVSYGATDDELATAIDKPGAVLTVVPRAYRFILIITAGGSNTAHAGELGATSLAVLKRAANDGRLYRADWPDTVGDRPPTLDLDVVQASVLMALADVVAWTTHRDGLLKLGRGPSLKPAAKEVVLKDAANVCMYRGCGKRVDKIGKSSRVGNVGQLAHIVGADPNGPRGRSDSHALADKPENVMLVCYDHHRLIDAVDPEAHSIAFLQEMRREHMSRVSALLGQLAWPRAMPLVIRGGIAGQSSAITFREVSEALEGIGMSALHPETEYLSMAPVERLASNYGLVVLSQLRAALHRLITACQSGMYAPGQDNLAVFALHDTPVLALAGRIIGEARSTHVFQRDRALGTWKWHNPKKLTSNIALDIEVKVKASSASPVGLLTIALSDSFQDSWISDATRAGIDEGKTTWISIAAQKPRNNIVEAPCDLVFVMHKVREALRSLQGDLQVKSMDVILVAPVSVVFAFGQALQAGNHLPTSVFHRVNYSKPFEPAFTIYNDRVEATDSSGISRCTVQLQ
jgi:hypothetical protein